MGPFVLVCADGAAAMTGPLPTIITWVKEVGLNLYAFQSKDYPEIDTKTLKTLVHSKHSISVKENFLQ